MQRLELCVNAIGAARAQEIAKQEILRLDDDQGQARFSVASESTDGLRFIVTLRQPAIGGQQKVTP